MPKMRGIKPEFFSSDQVGECDPLTRLAFIYMWTECDDAGVLPASAKKIKKGCFPLDDVSISDIEKFTEQLLLNGLVSSYDVDGVNYWSVTGWRHQKIDKPVYRYPNKFGVVPKTKARLFGKDRSSYLDSRKSGLCDCCNEKPLVDIFYLNPLSLGGSQSRENYTSLCRDCQKGESSKSIQLFGSRPSQDQVKTTSGRGPDQVETAPGPLQDSQKMEDGTWKLETGSWNMETGNQNMEIKQEVADAPYTPISFLLKISKKYHEDIQQVLKHWSTVMNINFNMNANSKINIERAKHIGERLKEGYTLDQCFKAIDQCSKNEFNMATDGKNKTLYNDIKYIFTPERIERHLNHKTTAQRVTEVSGESAYSRIKKRMREAKEIEVGPSTAPYEHMIKN